VAVPHAVTATVSVKFGWEHSCQSSFVKIVAELICAESLKAAAATGCCVPPSVTKFGFVVVGLVGFAVVVLLEFDVELVVLEAGAQ